MVATDVAARGIDVSGVELVVQVEPPEDPKSFLHRSGRTARAGHSGDVVTIILPNQRRRTRRMMREAGLTVEPIDVTPDSPEVLELVGEVAEPVFGWTLEQSQPAGNPRRRKNGKGSADGERSGRSNRSGGRNKDRGKDKGGKPFKSERKDRRDRDQREERNDSAKKFEPKKNRAERRAAKFEGRDNREFEAREHRWVPNVSMTIIVGPKARSMTNVPRMRNAMTVIRKSSVAAVANVTTSMQGSHAIAMRTSGKRHSARVDR